MRQIEEAYREWFGEQPCHTEIESMEKHVSRFIAWLINKKGMVIERTTLQQEAA